MSPKGLIVLLGVALLGFRCRNPHNRVKLPECAQVIYPDSIQIPPFSAILNDERPKIVTLSNMNCFRMIDIPLLQRQIAENPEFDFIFYVENDTPTEELKRFVNDNRLPIVLFVDKDQEFRKKNAIHSIVSYVSRVVDADLNVCTTTMVGSPVSQFYQVMPQVRKQLHLKTD